MALNPRQERFVQEYLVDLNATAAAIRAGYSKKSAAESGHELLRNPEIASAVEAGKKAKGERLGLSQEWVLENLQEVVERCMQRAPVMVRQGREMAQLQDEQGRDVWQFDSKGATGALNLLGKHLGMFADRVVHEGTIELAVNLKKARERARA